MGQIICIVNQKEGVGKTSTAINLSAALALAEKESLLVDCDPRGYATTGMGIDKTDPTHSLYHGIIGKVPVENLLVGSELDYLKMLPAHIALVEAETELRKTAGGEYQLRNLLKKVRTAFDYIIIDAPSSLSLLTVNAVTAADLLIIPLQCEFHALENLYDLLQAVKTLKVRYNPGIKIAGILFTMFEDRESSAREFTEEVQNHFNGMAFQTIIPRHSHLQDSAGRGKPLFLTDIMSAGAQCYLELARELIGKWPSG